MNTLTRNAAAAAASLFSLFVLGAGCAVTPESSDEGVTAKNGDALSPALCLDGSGAYCGNDGMSGADANTLYHCPGANQAPTSSQHCANGCVPAPPNSPDYCAGTATPLCLDGSGAYCGNDGMSGADANTLYHCPGANQAPTSSQHCANGCVKAPANSPDYCAGAATPLCLDSAAGVYCGNDEMSGAKASTLYWCPGGANKAPTSSQACGVACVNGGANSPDYCVHPSIYKLPWHAGTSIQLSQDCNEGDHIGVDKYAYDFLTTDFPKVSFSVRAARAGTVTHLKINSTAPGGGKSVMGQANYLVIDHGDGTQATYLHLLGNSLAAGVTCGAHVAQGQSLALAGSTGWSEAIHLHFQVSKKIDTAPTCECGAGGKGCAAGNVNWGDFWPDATHPILPISFEEWPAAASCSNRGIIMPPSQN